jgi:hypothetical protein
MVGAVSLKPGIAVVYVRRAVVGEHVTFLDEDPVAVHCTEVSRTGVFGMEHDSGVEIGGKGGV